MEDDVNLIINPNKVSVGTAVNPRTKLQVIGSIFDRFIPWLHTLSERTLALTAIAILHIVFMPNVYAFLNGATDKLPSLDSYLLVVVALVIMNLRAIIKRDSIQLLIHLVGFTCQLGIIALILLK